MTDHNVGKPVKVGKTHTVRKSGIVAKADLKQGARDAAKTSKRAAASEKADNLTRYHAKRDFQKTAEPEGRLAAGESFTYIIQKHEASHLHYDFRLELDGTLKSWAVPKGPSYDPRDKRLAMEVEDHPVEYATFEGVIPQGEYGGGTVMLWDRGTWEPVGDPRAGLIAGKLVFRLNGERLQGEWTLVRFHTKEKSHPDVRHNETEHHPWFLMKHRDDFVRKGDAGKFVAENITSVASGRTMSEIAAARSAVWTSDSSKKQSNERERIEPAAHVGKKVSDRSISRSLPEKVQEHPGHHDDQEPVSDPSASARGKNKGKSPAALPGFIEPQLATLSDAMPKGEHWVHEVKFDGYRMLAYIENGTALMVSRNKKDWTASFAVIAECVAMLPVKNAIIDGEVIVMDADGKSNFSQLKNALSDGNTAGMQYFAFDLLFLDGEDLRALPLSERKAKLAGIVAQLPANAQGRMHYSAEFDDAAGNFFQSVCSMQLEGVISKRADAPYFSGRGKTWLKTKCLKREEFVIGGFTPPANGSDGIGALLLGYYDGKTLRYAGRVGTGWNSATAVRLRKALEKIVDAPCAFATIATDARRHAQWVKPKLVCEVQFTEWTPDGHLRHPSFQGLREDKSAKEIVRDHTVPVARATEEAALQMKGSPKTRHVQLPSVHSPAVQSPGVHSTAAQSRSMPSPTIQAPGVKVRAVHGTVAHDAPAIDDARNDDATHNGSAKDNAGVNAATVGGVRISHPNRIVFPDVQISKQQLAEYYLAISEKMLPHIVHRPISMLRCPDGSGETCFFQRHLGVGNSPHLHELRIPVKGADQEYLMIKDLKGLLALVQWGVIEIHPWQCGAKKLAEPDRMIFDLDPDPTVSWESLIEGAFEVRSRMAELGLTSFVKTTGGKGLHVVVPMQPAYGWETIKSFAQLIAQSMAADSPQKYLSRMSKAARKGRIFVDYLRNEITATAVAPFSVRARPGATVSTPLAWSELSSRLNPADFTIATVMTRAAGMKADPWAGFFELKQKLQKKHLKALNLAS